jgi:hypothetical protein
MGYSPLIRLHKLKAYSLKRQWRGSKKAPLTEQTVFIAVCHSLNLGLWRMSRVYKIAFELGHAHYPRHTAAGVHSSDCWPTMIPKKTLTFDVK